MDERSREAHKKDFRSIRLLTGLFKYNPLFPISEKDRYNLIQEFRTARDMYLPLIEERIGVDLGSVPITDLSSYFRSSLGKLKEDMIEKAENQAERDLSSVIVPAFRPFAEILRMSMEDFPPSAAHYFPNGQCVVIPFGFSTKLHLYNKFVCGPSQNEVNQIMIHELTHHIWEKTPNRTSNRKTPKFWYEGFAIYGAFNWFADFLPEEVNAKWLEDYPSDYIRGKEAIEKLVKRHGRSVLLDIPSKWPQLQREVGLKSLLL